MWCNRSPRAVGMVTLAASAAAVGLLVMATPTQAVDFFFDYTDPAGTGFNDPVLGPQRQAAMAAAGQALGRLLQSTYIGETVTVTVGSNPNAGANVLASSRPAYFYGNFGSSDARYQTDTHYPKALADALAGHDLQPGNPDITVTVNTSQSFYWGTDKTVPAGQYDFVSVATHELIHGIGLYGTVRQNGGYGVFGDGSYNPSDTGLDGFPAIFDHFATLGGSTPVISLSSSSDRANALLSNNLFWSGGEGNVGNGGSPPKLYAPSTYVPGSTYGHLDQASFPNDLVAPNINSGVFLSPSPVDRGMLYDMGWNIAVFNGTVVTFTGSGGNNLASNLGNWNAQPLPSDNLTFGSNAGGVYNVSMDSDLGALNQITFAAGAPSYTLRFRSYTDTQISGPGVVNNSGNQQTIVLETYADDVANNTVNTATAGEAALLSFANNASAGNATYQVHGGFTAIQQLPNSPPTFIRYAGAHVDFLDASTAGAATFNVQGATGDGAPATYARINFRNTSNGGTATITNMPGQTGPGIDSFGNITSAAGFGGQTIFHDTASGGSAHISNQGQDEGPGGTGTGGITNFLDNSSGGGATIENFGATYTTGNNALGGRTQFQNSSTAGSATLINHDSVLFGNGPGAGNTSFLDTSSAGNATIENLPDSTGGFGHSAGFTTFVNSASAGHATINNRGATVGYYAGYTAFHDQATGGTASIHCYSSSNSNLPVLDFYDSSSAGAANISLDNSGGANEPLEGLIQFHNSASAGSANVTANVANSAGQMIFHDTSSGGSSHITIGAVADYRVIFQDSSTAGNCTINGGGNSYVQLGSNATAGTATITVQYLTFGGSYNAAGLPTVSADHALLHVPSATGTFSGGFLDFGNWSGAGDATIVVDGAASASNSPGTVSFGALSTAGNATIILNSAAVAGQPGGSVHFGGGASGGTARITANAGTLVDFGGNASYGGTTVALVQGAGTVNLGGGALTTGSAGVDATISGPLVDQSNFGGSITKVGAAALTLSGASSYSGATTVLGGVLHLAGSNAKVSDYATGPGALLTFDTPYSIHALTGGGTTIVNAPLTAASISQANLILHASLGLAADSGLSAVSILSFDPSTHLDIANNPVSIGSTTLNAIRQLITAGQITSSSPNPNHLLGLGYVDEGGGSVLVHFTYFGDANLDGKVNADDYALLDKGYDKHSNYWQNGDFNGDGVINSADYLLADTSYGKLSGQLPEALLAERAAEFGAGYVAALTAAVPEPSLLLLVVLVPLWLRRPRSRR